MASPHGDLPDCQDLSLSEQPVLRYRVNGPVAGTKKKGKKQQQRIRKAKTIDLHLHADLITGQRLCQ